MRTFQVLFLFFIIGCSSIPKEASLLSQKKLFFATVENNNCVIKIDKSKFINEINKALFKGENIIDKLEVKSDSTFGDTKVSYNYLNLSSSKKHINIVRYLFNYEGELYIENSNLDNFTFVDFYISCEGYEGAVQSYLKMDLKLHGVAEIF